MFGTNATGSTSFSGGNLTIRGGGAAGIGTSNEGTFHLVYVDTALKGDFYEAEVDIVMASSSLSNANNASNLGLAVIKGNPANLTPLSMGYFYNAFRASTTLNAAPLGMRKPSGGDHNNGGAISGTWSLGTITTLGLVRKNERSATASFKIDGGNTNTRDDDNRDIFVDADDVYVGLIVASQTATESVMVINALRVK